MPCRGLRDLQRRKLPRDLRGGAAEAPAELVPAAATLPAPRPARVRRPAPVVRWCAGDPQGGPGFGDGVGEDGEVKIRRFRGNN